MKISIILLAIFIEYSIASPSRVPLYGQCGGWDDTWNVPWTLPCDAGLTCVYQHQYYSQCLPVQGSTTQPPIQTTTSSTGGNPSCPSFIKGQFRLGISYDKATGLTASQLSNYDYVSIWLGTVTTDGSNSTDFNTGYQGAFLNFCKNNNKIPLFYGYVIAFEARHKMGLQDCDVWNTWNLCTNGSEFIRNNRQYLVNRYAYHAGKVAGYVGRTATVIFVMEPDFWQYYGDDGTNGKPSQFGGVLSGAYMRALFDDFVRAIKSELPNAIISWDISAWIGQSGFTTWWSFFSTADIQFIHTSGGQARGDLSQIKPGELSWKFVSQTTGRKIIADCGYGVAGALGSTCAPWTDQYNYQFDRIMDGVVSLSIANPVGNYIHLPVNC